MAQTLDGKVAHSRNEFINWTCKEDKKFFVAETKRVGTIIMGRATFDTIGKPLPGRTIIVMTHAPRESIHDNDGVVEFTSDAPETIIKKLEAQNKDEVILAGGPTINSLFLNAGLINEIKLTVEPKIFGNGLSLFEGENLPITSLELISCTNLTPQVLLVHYKVNK